MERILAIETATKVCSVAVAEEGELLGEFSLFVPQVHAERLVIMINNLLDNLRLSYRNLDAVAVSNGPGSFTGLRIGLSVAKGIAFGQNTKLIAVPTLEAIAGLIRDQVDSGKNVVPILHARSDEFYYSSFRLDNSGLKMATGHRYASAEEIAAEFPPDVIFVGEGVAAFSNYESVKRKFAARQLRNIPASAKEVAMIASEKYKQGEFADPRTSVPMYIKNFVAIKRNSFPKGIHLNKKLMEKI